MREQLEKSNEEVWINSRHMSNTDRPQSAEVTLSMVFWSTGTDLSQCTKAFTPGLEGFCEKSDTDKITTNYAVCCDTMHATDLLKNDNVSTATLNNHYPNCKVKFEHIMGANDGMAHASDRNQSGRNPELEAEVWQVVWFEC